MLKQKRISEYLLAFFLIIFYEFLCYYFILLRKPLHGDEHHFYSTIVDFSNNFSFDKIIHYNELITPLTFIVYGFFGDLFGTDLHTIRFLSLIIGGITHILLFYFLENIFQNKLAYWTLFMSWLLNPYIIGFNALVFTDGLSNLLILVFLYAFHRKNYFLVFISSALLLYTRQYNLLIVSAAGFCVVLESIRRHRLNVKMLSSIILGASTILPLFVLWESFSPSGPMTDKLYDVPFKMYFESLPVYIYCIFIFSLPLSFLALWSHKLTIRERILIFLITLSFYIVFPVSPSFIAVKDGFFTVGLYDKVVTIVFSSNFLKHIILYISFLLGSVMLYMFYKNNLSQKKEIQSDLQSFIFIYIIFFLAGMIVNFQIWEKYFIQVLPGVLILTGKILEPKLPKLSDDFKRFWNFKS